MMWFIDMINRLSIIMMVILIIPLIVSSVLYIVEIKYDTKKYERILVIIFGVMIVISCVLYVTTAYIGG